MRFIFYLMAALGFISVVYLGLYFASDGKYSHLETSASAASVFVYLFALVGFLRMLDKR